APDKGVMETTWLEADVDQSTKDKFRVSIEPGLHPGSSEIFVLHVNVPRNTPIIGRTNWPKISADLEREEELLNQLSSYLAERNNLYQATSVSLLAGNIVAESKAKLITLDGGEKVLQLRIDFPRAWATIGLALDKASIDIDDRDRDQAFYTVSFAGLDDEKRPGFFRRIFTSENAAESHTFNIKLVELESAVEVTIELVDSDEPQELLSEELMRAIHQNLG
ncbi:MAG: outer membrane protein assembly factor BamC, partial [SAR324 cluster bacterium]|nr:outer membrane protein assembly factor BamC [SAR324 cluster bacterium]